MTEEQDKINELILKNNELQEEIKNISFFSDQALINATLYKGIRLILEQQKEIKEKIEELKKDGKGN